MKALRLATIGLLFLLFLFSTFSHAQNPLMMDNYKGMTMVPYDANKRFKTPQEAITIPEDELDASSEIRGEIDDLKVELLRASIPFLPSLPGPGGALIFYDYVNWALTIAFEAPLTIENYLKIGRIAFNKEGLRIFDTNDRCIAFFDIFNDEMKANMLP